MAHVLAIDSNYDPPTSMAHAYRNAHIYPALPLTVRKLQGSMAKRAFVVNALRTDPGIRLITGVGHGLETVYTGHQGQAIFQMDFYKPAEVRGRIVHLLSCETASELGPDMVTNGAQAFLGYDVNFVFTGEKANLFFEADGAIDIALAQGRTVGEAAQLAIDAFDTFIDRLENTDGELDTETIAALETDRDHLMTPITDLVFGDSNARL